MLHVMFFFFFMITPGASALRGSMFGGGEGSIFLSQLTCNGSESRLVDCPLPVYPLFILGCGDHSNDAGVVCRGEVELDAQKGGYN